MQATSDGRLDQSLLNRNPESRGTEPRRQVTVGSVVRLRLLLMAPVDFYVTNYN